MLEFRQLKSNLKKDFSSFPVKRVALLGDSPTQLLNTVIRGYGYENQMNYAVYEADFNQIEMQILNAKSNLYQFNPEFTVVYFSSENLFSSYCKLSLDEQLNFADTFIDKINLLNDTLLSQLKTNIIYINFCVLNDNVFGNFANKTPYSFLFQIRKLNYELMLLAIKEPKLFVADFDLLQSVYGLSQRKKESTYINTGFVTDINFIPHLGKQVNDIILSITGKFKKCLILDLDNTLWGGIIGDDGVENIQIGSLGIGKAFYQFQLWIKQLKQRGIILVVCSKNDEDIAKFPFENHPEMVLKLEDISVFVANWDNKADNIRSIQSVLNIGFDTMVFIDDNPFERNLVKRELPSVLVPDMPNDPAEYLKYLQSQNLFETASFSLEDQNRTDKYQEETKRTISKKLFTNEDDYLESLLMVITIESFDTFTIPRVAQLSQRSNQFNLRTIRYDESDLHQIIENPNYVTLAVNLNDIYGDYGLISILVLQKEANSFFIENWLMSCRVLNRGVEKFVLNKIVALAKQHQIDKLVGEYIETDKNKMVKNHYENLGFKSVDSQKWSLNVADYTNFKNHINEKNE
jgi:FkbH-like protein